MLLSTFLNILFIPVLYVVVETLRERVTGAPAPWWTEGPSKPLNS